MRTLVIYDADPDGFGCAWAAWKWFASQADYMEILHGSPLPPDVIDEYDVVYVFDLSFSCDEYMKMLNNGINVLVIDHHPTSEALHTELGINAMPVDNTRAACVQVWKYFHDTTAPPLLRYVADRDVWAWELEYSEEINNVVSAVCKDFHTWTELNNELEYDDEMFEAVVDQGRLISNYRNRLVDWAVESHYVDNNDVPKVCASMLHSEIGHRLLSMYPDAPYVMTYTDNLAKNIRKYSMRSEDHRADVSKIARKHGGGGHRNAAGFSLPLPQGSHNV